MGWWHIVKYIGNIKNLPDIIFNNIKLIYNYIYPEYIYKQLYAKTIYMPVVLF